MIEIMVLTTSTKLLKSVYYCASFKDQFRKDYISQPGAPLGKTPFPRPEVMPQERSQKRKDFGNLKVTVGFCMSIDPYCFIDSEASKDHGL